MHFPSSMVFSAQIQRDSWSHVVRAIFADVPLGKLAKNPRFIENTENTWILMKFQQNQVFLCVYGKMVNFVVKYSVWSRLDTLQSQLWMEIPSETWSFLLKIAHFWTFLMHFPSSVVFSAQIRRDSCSLVVSAIFADVPLGKLTKHPRFIVNTKNTWILMKFKQSQGFLGVYWKYVCFVLKYSVWPRFDTLQSQLWVEIPSGTWPFLLKITHF